MLPSTARTFPRPHDAHFIEAFRASSHGHIQNTFSLQQGESGLLACVKINASQLQEKGSPHVSCRVGSRLYGTAETIAGEGGGVRLPQLLPQTGNQLHP